MFKKILAIALIVALAPLSANAANTSRPKWSLKQWKTKIGRRIAYATGRGLHKLGAVTDTLSDVAGPGAVTGLVIGFGTKHIAAGLAAPVVAAGVIGADIYVRNKQATSRGGKLVLRLDRMKKVAPTHHTDD